MDRVQRKVISSILGRYSISFNDIYLKGNDMYHTLAFAKEEICYTLYSKYSYSLGEIRDILGYAKHNHIRILITKYTQRNKLKQLPKQSLKLTLRGYINILHVYGIDLDDGFSLLSGVYRAGWQAGHNSARRRTLKKNLAKAHFDILSKGGASLVPSYENNAPVTLLERPKGILLEGDTSEIKPPD